MDGKNMFTWTCFGKGVDMFVKLKDNLLYMHNSFTDSKQVVMFM